jgi:uncharacterized protein Yka (UPF0111/DUF47 family)
METVTDRCADEVRSQTATYLGQVRTTTSHLPDALDAYGDNRAAFEAAVDRLGTHESECDATLRELRSLVGESLPPNYTDVYLRADDVVRLYARIDEVPNRTESFARELASMRPDLPAEVRDALREMAALVVEATVLLTEATEAYVDQLVSAGDPVRVTGDVERIGTLESDCDGHKYDALSAAFESCETGDALVARELLLTLDDAMDAVEDAAEHLLSMNSATH